MFHTSVIKQALFPRILVRLAGKQVKAYLLAHPVEQTNTMGMLR